MKVIITENQLFIFRRIQEFIDIVEKQIKGYEKQEDNPWWCRNNNPEDFLQNLKTGGANMDISVLNDIVYREYGNYIRNLFVSKCGYSRF